MWNTKTQILKNPIWNTKTQIIFKIQCGIQNTNHIYNPLWNTKTQIIYKIQCGIQKHKSSIKSNVEYKNTNHI